MTKDLEALAGGFYFLGGMAFITWFVLSDTPANRLIISLSARPFGRAFVFPLILVYWTLWPIALVGIALWALKERKRVDA